MFFFSDLKYKERITALFHLNHFFINDRARAQPVIGRSILNFNIPLGNSPRAFKILKISSFKFPPPTPGKNLCSNTPLVYKSLLNDSFCDQRMLQNLVNHIIVFWCRCLVFRWYVSFFNVKLYSKPFPHESDSTSNSLCILLVQLSYPIETRFKFPTPGARTTVKYLRAGLEGC